MNHFPNGITFCYPWRSYQKEALENLKHHLDNNHFHLIAPPGSGKTVLGLEVMLRINKPTLIVAPTLAIRNQWVDRFTELFLQIDYAPDWISTDLKKPQFLTVTTYQGLHALYQETDLIESREEALDDEVEDKEPIIEGSEKEKAREAFYKQNFQTLILDEAHHLRTSWWRTVTSVKENLINPTVIALTATPPYDVGNTEWNRYIELCGPIDEEIDVSALVKEGDLCPHQDYLWISMPTRKEKKPIDAFHLEAEQLRKQLLRNQNLKLLIESHPWIKSDENIEEKLEQYSYFISMIIYLRETGSDAWKLPFQFIEENPEELPSFTLEWAEILLTSLLYRDDLINLKEEPIKGIRKNLSQMGAIERRRVKLIATKSMERTLMYSASKLDSIVDIVTLEKKSEKEALRLVILADYIYARDLPGSKGEDKPLIRLGVIPIFEKLRRELKVDCKLGVLTGSVVILPKDAVSLLENYSIDFQVNSLSHDDRYVTIQTNASSRHYLVQIVTEIFSQGAIDVLTGTTALLGEGWDAPSVNTLILASSVGTFMLTNQMRGRAIRTERGNPEKCANIWHLVCVDEHMLDGGYDYMSLKRRFRSLSGIDEQLPLISNGLERLRIPDGKYTRRSIRMINEVMANRAINRQRLFERWQVAVQDGKRKREELYADKKAIPRPFIMRHTVKSLLIITGAIIINALYAIGDSNTQIETFQQLLIFILIGTAIGLVLSIPYWWKALRIFIFNSSVEKSMQQVGEVIYHTLYEMKLIGTAPELNQVCTQESQDGEIICYLERGTIQEQKLFTECLEEFIQPIDNPRYILMRKSGKRFWVRKDYHAIPEEIGRRKENAERFLTYWNRKIGNGELLYTRTPEGRNLLLKARMSAMSTKFVPKSKRISVWR